MSYPQIECAHCGKAFTPLRKWARFCCPKCKMAFRRRAQECVTAGSPISDGSDGLVTQQSADHATFAGLPEHKIDPLRYRPALLDKDIRDKWARNSPGNLEMPDLPAFLKRRPPPDGLGA